jgi:DNA modification methylase
MNYTKEDVHPQAVLSAFAPTVAKEPQPEYQQRSLYLAPVKEVFEHLSAKDWAFSEADTRFMGHDLHPYPAKFIPQIPGSLISLLSERGEIVFDPFGGSGTTALEAIRLGRRAISADANPLAALIGKVKTARVNRECARELHTLHGLLCAELNSLPTNAATLVEKYGSHAPEIANRTKWFPDTSFGELSFIRFRIKELQNTTASDIALLALSRTVLAASFQDSETRYKSVPRSILSGETMRRFTKELEAVMRSVARNESATRYGVSHFVTADSRTFDAATIPDGAIDLIVTSPPYGNATDYHLYHRFRLLWLGFDPISLGRVEIGSHLKHQREASGFASYFDDMRLSLKNISRILKNGRYAVLVIGDSVYEGKTYNTTELLAKESKDFGFDASCIIPRAVHKTKRSFTIAGRRAATENLLVLRKRACATTLMLEGPPYKLWPYEHKLRKRETGQATEKAAAPGRPNVTLVKKANVADTVRSRSLVFTHQIRYETGFSELTWQAVLENGAAPTAGARKDPKYVTHGIHSYKGKFYPQLAKGLINLLNLPSGARILDPFCGSGTTLLEGYLNGLQAFGCDMHPLAAMIARAKSGILEVEPDLVTEVVSNLLETLERPPNQMPKALDQFNAECIEEIEKWFVRPVSQKLNWLLRTIRQGSAGPIRDFLEVVLSSIVRDVSQQEPTDLRIRYRKKLLADADVLGLFRDQLALQFARVEKFWKVRGYAPHRFYPAFAVEGDNRQANTFDALGISTASVDLVLTSPPYAMALPYIDTDRLSLLTLFGVSSSDRRPLEQGLTGSRELSSIMRKKLEEQLELGGMLPTDCQIFIRKLLNQVSSSADAGFRKQNMPALLFRFLCDMSSALKQIHRVCKPGAEAMIVIGDSRMTIDGKSLRIPTTDHVEAIALQHGFSAIERIDISVTTENLVHIGNAITENVVLRLRKQHR